MKKIVLFPFFLFFSFVINSSAADYYDKFYGNDDNCSLLSKSTFDAYAIFAENHFLIISLDSPLKYEKLMREGFLKLSKYKYITDNRELFSDVVLLQLIKDGFFISDRYGIKYLYQNERDFPQIKLACLQK